MPAIRFTAAVAVSASLFICSCTNPSKPPGEKNLPTADSGPRITQFYATDPIIRGKAGKTKICYGTEFATEVKLDPPVERLWPSPSRCFDVSPTAKTTYTITASTPSSQPVTKSLTIDFGPPAAKILELRVDATEIKPGAPWSACVKAQNVARWELSAGKWIQGPNPSGGCFADSPKQTTTYLVQAVGALGEVDSERFTLTVR